MHHAVGRHRCIPAIGLVDALWRAIIINDQVFRPKHIAKRRATKRRSCCHLVRPTRRLGVCVRGLWVGRLEAETARRLYRPQQQLQHM